MFKIPCVLKIYIFRVNKYAFVLVNQKTTVKLINLQIFLQKDTLLLDLMSYSIALLNYTMSHSYLLCRSSITETSIHFLSGCFDNTNSQY